MATHDLMYDSEAHVYMSRINPDSPDLTEDSDLPSSPVAQPSEEAPNFVPKLPDVSLVPYVHVPPPSLNPSPKISKKRPQAALNEDFTHEPVPYTDKYKPHPTHYLPVCPTNANDRWDPVIGHAWPYCCKRCIKLPWKNPPPFVPEPSEDDGEYYDEEYEERVDTPTKQLCDVHKDDNEDTHMTIMMTN